MLIKIDRHKFRILNQKDFDWIYLKDYVIFDSLHDVTHEIESPAMVGDRGYLISLHYGLLDHTLGKVRFFLKKWRDIIFQDALYSVLMTDSLALPYIFFSVEEKSPN